MILWKKTISAIIALTLSSSQCVWATSHTINQEKIKSNMEITFTKAPLVEPYLLQGKLREGEVAMRERLASHPKDDQARFGLGVLQFLRAVENLGQSFYRFGLRTYSGDGFVLPFLRLPAPVNPKAEQISYEQLRAVMSKFLQNLTECEFTLSQIEDGDVKLPLHFGMIHA